MGQINLVREAILSIKEKGSFTLISGVLNDEPIFAGVAASTVSGALEAFVRAAAIELPKLDFGQFRRRPGEPILQGKRIRWEILSLSRPGRDSKEIDAPHIFRIKRSLTH